MRWRQRSAARRWIGTPRATAGDLAGGGTPGALTGPLTICEVLARSTAFLADRGSASPRLDAELLLARALGCERIDLYVRHDRPLTGSERDEARELVARRGRREPVAHILGRRAFRRLELRASPAALVPRPETEVLVDRAVARARDGDAALDWGTGSGAVALALVDEGPGLTMVGADRSVAALELARQNGEDLSLDVEWVASDGFSGVAGRRFALVVANPPYLSTDELRDGPPELSYEPAEALCAGPTGLEALERLSREAAAHLTDDGWLLAEIGAGQGDAAAALWRAGGYSEVVVHPDLAGLPRVVEGRR